MKKSAKVAVGIIAAVVILVAVFAGGSKFFKGALMAARVCDVINVQSCQQIGKDILIFRNGVYSFLINDCRNGVHGMKQYTEDCVSPTSYRECYNVCSGSYTSWRGALLSAAVDADTPAAAIVTAGSTDIPVAKYRFTAKDEAFHVSSLTVVGTTTPNTGFSTGSNFIGEINLVRVGLSYTKKDGTTETQYALMNGGKALFTNLNFYVPNSESAVITILADINIIEKGAISGYAFRLGLGEFFDKSSFYAVGETSAKTAELDIRDLFAPPYTNRMIVRNTVPIVGKAINLPTRLINGQNDIAGVNIRAGGRLLILKRLVFEISASPMDVRDLKLYRKYGSYGGAVDITSSVLIQNEAGQDLKAGGVPLFSNSGGQSSHKIYVYFSGYDAERISPMVTPYILKATVTNASVNEAISSYVADDTQIVTGTLQEMIDGKYNFIWSDLPLGPIGHTLSTKDWTNGADVPNLPTATHALVY